MIQKQCKVCGETKDESGFTRVTGNKYGLDSKCKECKSIANRKGYIQNKEKITQKRLERKEDKTKYDIEYKRNRRKGDILYKISDNISRNLRKALTKGGYRKGSRTGEIVGLDWVEFKEWIERNWEDGMSWENYGQGVGRWNIDHTIPQCSGDSEDEIVRLNHWTNLKPMWAVQNASKNGKYEQVVKDEYMSGWW
jgi:hypothetical protein